MSGLETAIRNALERSDRDNAETRARIYQSARQALETGLRKQNIDDPEAINFQRRRLEALIHDIEREERMRRLEAEAAAARLQQAAATLSVPERPEPSLDMQPAARQTAPRPAEQGGARQEPGFAAFNPAPVAEDRTNRDPAFGDDFSASPVGAGQDRHLEDEGPIPDMRSERAVAPRRQRGAVARLMISVIFLAAIALGAWWVYTSGLLLTDAERDTSVPNPPPRVESEDFTGDPAGQTPQGPQAIDTRGGFSDAWIDVFSPAQISALRPRANALVDVVTASDGEAVRLVSRSGDEQGSVEVAVPTEVLRELAGRTSTIALTLQSVDDNPVQIAVDCEFPRMGDCSRHRFTVNAQKIDALFRVSFENGMAPSTPGSLVINGDIAGTGRGVNIYAIRVLPGQ
ncbi:hypothetical protein ACSV9I_17920 [Rhizobium sp. G187]|uniref:hypothetical protein n=1 Tax=Rhizobium sp. G187 TaxID=3451352 RepID=UPI003EE5B17F